MANTNFLITYTVTVIRTNKIFVRFPLLRFFGFYHKNVIFPCFDLIRLTIFNIPVMKIVSIPLGVLLKFPCITKIDF